MALTINGKKNRLKKIDFDKLAESLEISHITAERVYNKFRKNLIPHVTHSQAQRA
jgi:serine/threonine-protein kinase HipA